MSIPTTEQTESIHADYNRLTKQDLRYSISNHFVWEMYLSRGYTVDDLKLVTGYIWGRIKAGKRQKEAFRFSNLIGRLDNFEEERALAQSEATIAQKEACRPVVSPAKASVCRATGRPQTSPERDPVQAAAVVRGLVEKWAKELQ